MKSLDGYKTYIVGAAWILFGIVGLLSDRVEGQSAAESILTGLAIITGRDAIRKIKQ